MSKVIQRWGRLEECKETAQYFPITDKKIKKTRGHMLIAMAMIRILQIEEKVR